MKEKNNNHHLSASHIVIWACFMALAAVYLYWPVLAQAAISFRSLMA